jgi:nucleoside-diphosphate-sugar epimerase
MNTQKRILVTGSTGRIGAAVVQELAAAGHAVVALDVREPLQAVRGNVTPIVGSVTDGPLLKWLAKDVDCVIHLAATPDDAKTTDGQLLLNDDNFLSGLLPNNVQGAYAVMEAVRVSRGKRVILASTGQVIDGHLPDGYEPRTRPALVTADSPHLPAYLYACTKVFLEMLGRVYANHHGIQSLAVRLGWCPRDANQIAQITADAVSQDVYLSPGDAGRFFRATVEAATLPPFAVVYATSRFTHHLLYDLSGAKTLLGWEPRDQWPTGV